MTEKEKVEVFKQIDFGDIDANSDPNLESYFIDNNFWDKIVVGKTYYIYGKKGTGKSALYRYLQTEAMNNGALCRNLDFGNFPLETLFNLSDNEFSKPNQYHSIWLHLILTQMVENILKNMQADSSNIYYKKIKEYAELFIGDLVRSSAISFARIKKNEFGLQLSKAGVSPNISSENELSESFATNYTNLSEVNRLLTDVLLNYYITSNDDTRYLIQFDRLDDCYNQYQTVEEYYQLIISLLKSVYNLNNAFRVKKIDSVKTVVYIRSDIVFEIQKRDAESARWDDFAYKLNWTIIVIVR